MSRPLRIEYPDAYYHIMNRGRQAIFHDEAYFQAFLQTLSEFHERLGLAIHAYCLMTNHFHLLVKTPERNLQRAMRHIGGVYTQRYKAILVNVDEYLLHPSRYIHRNPLGGDATAAFLIGSDTGGGKCQLPDGCGFVAHVGKGKKPAKYSLQGRDVLSSETGRLSFE